MTQSKCKKERGTAAESLRLCVVGAVDTLGIQRQVRLEIDSSKLLHIVDRYDERARKLSNDPYRNSIYTASLAMRLVAFNAPLALVPRSMIDYNAHLAALVALVLCNTEKYDALKSDLQLNGFLDYVAKRIHGFSDFVDFVDFVEHELII